MAAATTTPAAAAEMECPNKLADRYCDWDGDLVADLLVERPVGEDLGRLRGRRRSAVDAVEDRLGTREFWKL